MNKITFFITFLLFSSHGVTLNLSSTYNKDIKMSITSVEDYKIYRLNQLEVLRNQGMDLRIYGIEVEKTKNITQSISSLNITNKFEFRINEREKLDIVLPKSYLEMMQIED